MPMDQWLKERENYDEIKRLTFFTKFRKWKTLKMWKTNVTRHKTTVCKKILEEKLFLLHPVLVRIFKFREKHCLLNEYLHVKWKR